MTRAPGAEARGVYKGRLLTLDGRFDALATAALRRATKRHRPASSTALVWTSFNIPGCSPGKAGTTRSVSHETDRRRASNSGTDIAQHELGNDTLPQEHLQSSRPQQGRNQGRKGASATFARKLIRACVLRFCCCEHLMSLRRSVGTCAENAKSKNRGFVNRGCRSSCSALVEEVTRSKEKKRSEMRK